MKILENISNGSKRIATGIAIVGFLTILYLALIPGGSFAVSGVYSALTGSPIGSAVVKLVDYPQYNATTDSVTGVYTMPNVPEGTYKINASKSGYYTNTSTVTVIPNDTVTKDFLLTLANKTFIPWTATKGGWTTPYVIVNKGNGNATVNISYYDASTGALVGTTSKVIKPGASSFEFRESTPGAAGTDGSAVLETDEPVSVMVDQFGAGLGSYEVSLSGAKEVFLPWTSGTNGWTTPFVIVNQGTATATVSITYYYVNGTEAGVNSVNIIPGASTFVFRESTTASEGAAKLSSDQDISVLVDMFGPGGKFSAYTPANTADSRIFIPWTATTGGWTTPFRIVNRGLNTSTVNISYYSAADGQVKGYDEITIAPNNVAQVFRENTTATGTDGSAVLNSTEPISVIVEQSAGSLYEAYTPEINAGTKIYIPWTATTGGWTTPYVVVNKGTETALVNITYYNAANGANVGNRSVTLDPGSSTFVFRESTAGAAGTDGSAVLESNQPIAAMVDQFAGSLFGAYTALG